MSLETMNRGTEGMKEQAQKLIEQAYNRGFKTGYDKAFSTLNENWQLVTSEAAEKGRNESWELAYRLVFNQGNIRDVFDTESLGRIFETYSASEAIERIKAHEEKKQEEDEELKVGDEVVTVAGDKGVVTGIINNDVYLFISGWETSQVKHKLCCKKTGRHFPEIVEVLKSLKEEK